MVEESAGLGEAVTACQGGAQAHAGGDLHPGVAPGEGAEDVGVEEGGAVEDGEHSILPSISLNLHSKFNKSEENSSFLHLNPRRNADIDYFFATKVVAPIVRNLSDLVLCYIYK